MCELKGYLEDKRCKVAVDDKKYKLKATVKSLEDDDEEGSGDEANQENNEEGKSQEDQAVQLSVKILEVES